MLLEPEVGPFQPLLNALLGETEEYLLSACHSKDIPRKEYISFLIHRGSIDKVKRITLL